MTTMADLLSIYTTQAQMSAFFIDKMKIFSVLSYNKNANDGVTVATTAIQTALDECGQAGGGIVFFPAGTYLTDLVKVNYSNVHLVGSGIGATKIKLINNAPDACIQFGDYGTVVDDLVEDVSISDIEIDGNKANQSGAGLGIGIRAEDVERIIIERVKVHDCDGYGIGLVGTSLPHRADFTVKDSELHDNYYDGMDIKGGATRITIINVRSHDNGGGTVPDRAAHGIDARGEFVTLLGCYAWNNQDHGISTRELSYSKRTSIIGCHAYDNTSDGIIVNGDEVLVVGCTSKGNRYGYNISSSVKRAVVTSCSAYNNGTIGFYIDDISGGFTLSDCVADSNGGDTTTGRGVQISSTTSPWTIQGCTITDDDTPGNQDYAIYFSGSNVAGNISNNCVLSGSTGVIFGTIPSGTIVSNNGDYLTGTATLDPINLADGAGQTLTITVTGAVTGDYVLVSPPYSLQGITMTAWVNASNVVGVRLQNETGGAIDLASGTWKAKVIKG